jgi:hypothetical protein
MGVHLTADPIEIVSVPLHYPTSMVYVDESGTAGNGAVFVVGALKVRKHGALARAIRDVRDRTGFDSEFRFNRINRTTAHHFTELLSVVDVGDIFLAATVVDRRFGEPFAGKRQRWDRQAEIVSTLLRGSINKRELVSVAMDEISTPPDVAFEDEVATRVNRRFQNKAIITAAMLDSKTCDGLQLVDVMTSAIAADYRRRIGEQKTVSTHKETVINGVKRALDVVELDGRGPRHNIKVLKADPKALKSRKVVPMNGRRAG